MSHSIYDKQEFYDKTLAPIVKELKLQCTANQLPMFLTIATANNENETTYQSEVVFGTTQKKLTDNHISQMLLFFYKFDIHPPEHIQKAIDDVNAYYEHIKEKTAEQLLGDLTLTDDKISGLTQIDGGYEISFDDIQNLYGI